MANQQNRAPPTRGWGAGQRQSLTAQEIAQPGKVRSHRPAARPLDDDVGEATTATATARRRPNHTYPPGWVRLEQDGQRNGGKQQRRPRGASALTRVDPGQSIASVAQAQPVHRRDHQDAGRRPCGRTGSARSAPARALPLCPLTVQPWWLLHPRRVKLRVSPLSRRVSHLCSTGPLHPSGQRRSRSIQVRYCETLLTKCRDLMH